jgi:hypothetical protein
MGGNGINAEAVATPRPRRIDISRFLQMFHSSPSSFPYSLSMMRPVGIIRLIFELYSDLAGQVEIKIVVTEGNGKAGGSPHQIFSALAGAKMISNGDQSGNRWTLMVSRPPPAKQIE